jgi:hypothetical protein
MSFVLLSWIIGSALFFAGWFLGVIMARRAVDLEADHLEGFCDACYELVARRARTSERVVAHPAVSTSA